VFTSALIKGMGKLEQSSKLGLMMKKKFKHLKWSSNFKKDLSTKASLKL